jgi:hypothetical protein
VSRLASPGLACVESGEQTFLKLFPHRFDFIYANHPEPGTSPHWQTESRYPLTDRMVSQGSYLYGVRFGTQTQYCLLDIDRKSPYHPATDPFAIARIAASLEPIGLVRYVVITSSYSGGLHLYFPFTELHPAWMIGTAVTTILEKSGFLVRSGSLEVFPNRRPYSDHGKPSLFNAHRLPLQQGSYLLDQSFNAVWTDRQRFVEQWQLCQQQNHISRKSIERLIRQNRPQKHQVSGKAAQFLKDLNIEIEAGWTGTGQTNYLLGRITMKLYIFNHLLESNEPLEGRALVEKIVETACALPGYQDWCNHQHEIEQRATEWARCIESSRYFHYGIAKAANLNQPVNQRDWNQEQQQQARQRIQQAIAQLLEQDQLPAQTTARFKALVSCGVGGGSLYRHKDLWHPDYLTEPEPLEAENRQTNLLPGTGGNGLTEPDFGDFAAVVDLEGGCNSADNQGLVKTDHSALQLLSLTGQWIEWWIARSAMFWLLLARQWNHFLPLQLRPP